MKIMNWMSFMSSCGFCGSNTSSVYGFCIVCWEALEAEALLAQLVSRKDKVLSLQRLWCWEHSQSVRLNVLLTQIKGQQEQRAFAHIAKLYQQRGVGCQELQFVRAPIFIPAPPRIFGQRDHSHLFAEELAKVFNGDLALVLRRKGSGLRPQKRKSRSKRLRLQLGHYREALNYLKRECLGRPWIFVDDIYTTGATAFAAYSALGKPQNFQVVVVAERLARPKRHCYNAAYE
jgi:predicted amidophosphoribosyltransferase